MPNQILIKDLNLGGVADSRYQGQKNSVYELVGFDLHSEPGILKHNQKLTKESGGLIDDIIKCILPCSDGNTYLFGATAGKVWQRTSAGVYSLLVTAAPAAGTAGIIDAVEDGGYIYYSMQSRLGRVAVAAPTDWTARDDNWKTFANADADYHPFQKVNRVVYVGDGVDLDQIDAGTFSAQAIANGIGTPLRIKSLGKILTDLLIGTFVNVYRVATEILRWNTWSDSFNVSDEVPEIGINCFLKTDNYNLVNAGTKGNLYLYNGSQLDPFKRLPGDWTGANEALIHPNAAANMFGLPLFGLSNQSGNPALQGLYSLGGYDRNYPKVLAIENLISTLASTGIDIGAVEMVGTQLLVAWKQQTTVTISIANPAVLTFALSGLVNGDPIKFATTGALPTGLVAGTIYYARTTATADQYNLYDTAAHATAGGATGRVVTTGTQSGVHTATIWGVDKRDTAAKEATAYFTCRVINLARRDKKTLSGYIGYRSLPAGTSIKIYYKDNYAAAFVEAPTTIDTDRKIIEVDASFPEANTLEIQVISTANGNAAPEIEVAEFLFD